MPRHTLTFALVAVLAVSALAAPAALARPADIMSPQARNAASHRVQDLRRLNAGNHIRSTPFTPGYTPGTLRGREAYYNGTPPAAQQPARTVSTDDGAPWTMIALGLAGACVLLIAMLVARRVRLHTHIAA
jgi:hypothetical protein